MDCMRSGQDARKRVNKMLEQLGEGQEVTGQPARHHRQTTSPSPTAQYGAGHTSPSNFFNPTTIMNVLGSHSYPSLLNFTAALLFVVTGDHTCPHTHTSISNLLPVVCQTYSVHGNAICTALCWNCLLHIFSVIFFYLIPLILKILFSQCCIKNCTPLHHKAFDVWLWYFQ